MTIHGLIKWLKKATKEQISGKVTIILHLGGIRQAKIEQEIDTDS